MVLPVLPLVAGGIVTAAYLDAKHYIASDLVKARGLIDVTRSLNSNNKNDRNSIYYVFDNSVKKRKDAECLVCEGVSLSWNRVSLEVNRLAHFLLSRGVKRGDVIALYMPNKPAYPIIWLACLAIDVVPAFINFNLTDQGLRHCILVAKATMVLYESDLSTPIADITDSLLATSPNLQFVRWIDSFSKPTEKLDGITNSFTLNEEVLAEMSTKRIDDSRRNGVGWQSPACLIYTSGTTGLPKAAIVTHGRSATAFKMWTHINHFDTSSRIYTPMPLYHSTAALLAVGTSWNAGSTVIIGRKFSASTFWKDVRAADANVIQYVGEVLRFLLAVPPSKEDKAHKVKMAYGNGCRPDVWTAFRNRFGVDVISEFFASSEGNGSLYNYNANDLGAGAVGHEGTLASFARRKKQVLVRVDPLTEEPARGPDGFCIRTADNEDGELLCEIISDSPFQAFAGYFGMGGKAATEKKILTNVLSTGDAYFRTGDLLRKTSDGYYYFADRLGDTFRWKSENVSTTAVSEALGAVVSEANVYGVLVPSHEGRAGCAAIPSSSPIDWEKLALHVIKVLPKYAQPLFIRNVEKLESTGTEKQLKVALRNEGVDPDKVFDPVWWLRNGKYVRFTKEDYEALKAGKVKL